MFYLYNPETEKYIYRQANNTFSSTSVFKNALLFPNRDIPEKLLKYNNLPKYLFDRNGYKIYEFSEGIQFKSNKNPVSLSYSELEHFFTWNDRKLKIIKTYITNMMEFKDAIKGSISLIDNKVNLIYHVIESGDIKTPEEKEKIMNLLNRTLKIRRKIKEYIIIFDLVENNKLVGTIYNIVNKLDFNYNDFEGVDSFIERITNEDSESPKEN